MNHIIEEIGTRYLELLSLLPHVLHEHVLLTGGAAAAFYGSDRPFSRDIDVIIPKRYQSVVEEHLHLKFSSNDTKPVFHSLAAHISREQTTYDLVLESRIQPEGAQNAFRFFISREVEKHKICTRLDVTLSSSFLTVSSTLSSLISSKKIYFVPKEFLVLTKLLAGRGKAFGKFDLYDASKILENESVEFRKETHPFDEHFFRECIKFFCKPLSVSIPILTKRAKIMLDEYGVQEAKNLLKIFQSLKV